MPDDKEKRGRDPIETRPRDGYVLAPAIVAKPDSPKPTAWAWTRKARSAIVDLLLIATFAVSASVFFWSLS